MPPATRTARDKYRRPSDRLFTNEVLNFTEALQLFRWQLKEELADNLRFLSEELARPEGDRDAAYLGHLREMDHQLREEMGRADTAEDLYRRYTSRSGDAAAVTALRLAGLADFAHALEYGEYSGLAI